MTRRDSREVCELLEESMRRAQAIDSLIEHGTGYEIAEPETAVGLILAGAILLSSRAVIRGRSKQLFFDQVRFLVEWVWETTAESVKETDGAVARGGR
jgi:hypothetical protein